jgi:hypothetical protein
MRNPCCREHRKGRANPGRRPRPGRALPSHGEAARSRGTARLDRGGRRDRAFLFRQGHRCLLIQIAAQYLTLEQRYATCDPDVITPLIWTKQHVLTEDITYFRSENAYVWQVRGINSHVMGYAMAAYYALSIDKYNLFSILKEDGAFGCITFDIGGRKVSRDLLDSIIEIDFLDRHLGLMGSRALTILDIGAGYGRLAHRMTTAVPGLTEYICTDAVPCSSFISEYYLKYRKSEKSTVIPLDEIEKRLEAGGIDVAINIHSFSECRLEAID